MPPTLARLLAAAALGRAWPALARSTADIYYGEDAWAKAQSPATVMKLHMMPDKGLKGQGAVCLDGSDAGFYFSPAAKAADAKKWQIHIMGGGWCYDEIDCWGRSNTGLGSSKGWANASNVGGLMSDNCDVNPDFCGFNRVHLAYCDGNSFSGNRDQPLVVKGPDGKEKPLYFRGRRVLDAVLETLLGMGLSDAEEVLLSGCSAGGLATYLHTDYVHGFLEKAGVPLKKFRSAPVSGFFLLHNTVEGKPVYPQEMKEIYRLANSTHGLNDRCIAALAEEDRWKCNFAQLAYAYTESAIFPLNSALDSWQTTCIYTSELVPGFPRQNATDNGHCAAAKGWERCAQDVESCGHGQMAAMNKYIEDFEAVIKGTGVYAKAGNGAFIHSCHTHCEAMSDQQWGTFAVRGVTMREAFSRWWRSELEPAPRHSYEPCAYREDASPHRCNPSCGGPPRPALFV